MCLIHEQVLNPNLTSLVFEDLLICGWHSELTYHGILQTMFRHHAVVQHVSSPTRRDSSTVRENIFDVIVSTGTARLVWNVQVICAHGLSDHELVIWSIEI